MKVVMIETFDGMDDRRLGRCAIVEANGDNEEDVRSELQHYQYEVIQEFTEGATSALVAKKIALENAPADMMVFMANPFSVERIR